VTGEAGVGKTRLVREFLELYEGPQLLYQPSQPEGAWLEVPLEVKVKEPLRLLLNLTKKIHELLAITKLLTVFPVFDNEQAVLSSF
jgi:hypothetical protein